MQFPDGWSSKEKKVGSSGKILTFPAFEKADIPVLEETKERAIRRIADFATLRKAPLVSKRASIRSICYLNICDKILWVEKKREEEKFGRGRAGSQQKIANLPGPPEFKMRIVQW